MAHDQSKEFGDVLRRHRILAGYSQEELAQRASLSARAISDLERGVKRIPRRDTLQLLIEALDLSGEAREAFITAAREPAIRSSVKVSGDPSPAATEAPRAQIESPDVVPPTTMPARMAHFPVGGFLGALPPGALVGRRVEHTRILEAVNAIGAGEGRFVTLAGEPGVGKTRLAQEAMLLCRKRGFVVATGRCYEPQQIVPYYPFLEALSTLYTAAPETVRSEVSGRWPALLRLLPGQAPPSLPEGQPSPQEDQQRLFWAITGFIQAVSDVAPVALLLDDLQWADDASLELLKHLVRHTRPFRVFLLGVYRDTEAGRRRSFGRAIHELHRERLVDHISVSLFDSTDTADLIAAQVGQAVSVEFATLVHRHTDGNPLFVQETLRALIERGEIYQRDGRWERRDASPIEAPESVRATIADRVSRLSESAQEALREASVLGQTFAFEDLQAMGTHGEVALDTALEEALAAGLLQEAGESYVFNHALTQQTLYVDLPTRRRRRLHLAAGEALERLLEQAQRSRAAELAWHFREGRALERALPYAFAAGDYAQALYASAEAERHYEAALSLAESLHDRASEALAQQKLGWLMWLLARFDSSAQFLDRSASTYRALGDVEGEMRAVGLLGMLYFTVGPREGVRRVTELIDRLGESEPSSPLASLYVSLALNLLIAGQYREAAVAAERGAEIARALGDMRTLIRAEVTRGPALGFMGRLGEARRVGEEAIPIASAMDDYYGLLSAVHYLGAMCIAEGDFVAAQDYYRRALELAERLGAQSRISAETANLAETLYYLGDWQQARNLAERAVNIAQAESSGHAAGYFQYANVFRQLAVILAAQGGWRRAVPYLEEAVALSERLPYLEAIRASQGVLAEHELTSGDPEAALARLNPLLEGRDVEEVGVLQLLPTVALARAARGDAADAEHILDDAIGRARAQSHRLALVDLLRAQGMVLAQQERVDGALRMFEEAITVARGIAYPYAEGRALYAQGQLHSRAREWQTARERLREARGIFQRLGAQSDEERAAQAIAACAPA